jgi:hypothetical protein
MATSSPLYTFTTTLGLNDSVPIRSKIYDPSGLSEGTADSIKTSVLIILSLFIICMNIPVLMFVPRIKSLSNSTGVTMISLAFTDLGLGVFLFPFAINNSINGYHVYYLDNLKCKIGAFFGHIFAGTSILVLSFGIFDKFLTIVFPFYYRNFMTMKRGIIVVVMLWILSLITFSVPVIGTDLVRLKFHAGLPFCVPNYGSNVIYSLEVLIVFMMVPSLIILISLIGIFRVARKQNRSVAQQESADQGSNSQSQKFTKRDAKLVRTLLLMTASYYIMYFPIFVFILFWDLITGTTLNYWLNFFSIVSGFCNSFVNPLIYIPTIKDFRMTIKSALGFKTRDTDGEQTELSYVRSTNVTA